MADGSRHLDQSASHLSDQSTQLREASTTLSTRLADLGRQIGAAAERNGDAASALVQQFQLMDQLQRSLATAAEKGEQAAATAAASFSTLEAHQAKFLADLRKQVEALGESLQMQVMTLEDQAKQWLEAYSEAVRQQVDHRMERWNEVSLQYANQMLNTVNAISNIVDELEAKQ
jgi:hypothetical protein